MGSSASREDQVPLLEGNEEIQPIFEELKLVLIGSQGAGKNNIANAILKEKAFTFWTSYKSIHIKETRTVSGTQIHLTRTPGWRGDLSRSEQTKQEIVHCVQSLYSSGPHAILLALKVNTVLSESNINTLENLLTVQLWKHTIVLFTYGEKLGGYNIEDYIRCRQLQPLIDKCGKRYFVIRNNDSSQIIETILEFVARKNSAYYFKLSAQTDVNNTLLSDWRRIVERIKSKINSLSALKENLLSNPNTQNNDSLKRLLDLKDAEIKRLNAIVREKEREIERLQSGNSRTQDLSGLHRRITELEGQLHMMSSELEGKNTENKILKKQVKEKDAEIEDLKTALQMQQQKAIHWRTHEDQYSTVHAVYRSELCQDFSAMSIRSQNQIQLRALPSKGSALIGWSDTLLKILNELSAEDMEQMEFSMIWNEKYRICRSSVENRNRVKLADQMLKQWGEWQSVLNTRDLVKNIPRNDEAMKELFEPFLKSIGETW